VKGADGTLVLRATEIAAVEIHPGAV
jgi:hypothetical protein